MFTQFSAVTSSVTNWFSDLSGDKIKTDKESVNDENKENKSEDAESGGDTETESQPSEVTSADSESNDGDETETKDLAAEAKQALEDVSAKAKEWGTLLYSFGKTAGKTVADTAIQLTKTVEEKTFIGDFNREQDKFVEENQEKVKHSEAAVPPWVGYNEEETMKTQIMALSLDKRNFLRNPPAGVQFNFDFAVMHPIAIATLQDDSNLEKMRFELVPKQVKEAVFWRNYFYRVSLIKQSTQLTSLAMETGSTGEKSGSSSRRSSIGSDKDKSKQAKTQEESTPAKEEEFSPGSPQENEFVSDAFQENELSAEEVRKEMQMLGVDEELPAKDADDKDIPQWEKDLQKELQEYEMVGEEDKLNDDELENEILQQIEEETKAMT